MGIFQVAMKTNSTTIFLDHKYLSGNTLHSIWDIGITKQIAEAGLFHDTKHLDRLILIQEEYIPMVYNGLM